MDIKKGLERKLTPMGIVMQVIIIIISFMGKVLFIFIKENMFGLTAQTTPDSFNLACVVAMEFGSHPYNTKTFSVMKEPMLVIKRMDMESTNGKTVRFMKDSSRMI